MANQMKQGFFNMDTVIAVCNEKDLAEARKIALLRLEETKKNAEVENVIKALNMIQAAKSVKNLGIALANFILAHPSENLKTIR